MFKITLMSGIKEWNKWIRNKDLSAKEEKEKLKKKGKEKLVNWRDLHY